VHFNLEVLVLFHILFRPLGFTAPTILHCLAFQSFDF